MIRKIVSIDEEKCNGCGLCVKACHEEAMELVNGKAKLISDKYCDGLGDCLPECPTGAIQIIERESDPYDDDAVKNKIAERKQAEQLKAAHNGGELPCGCPGSAARMIKRTAAPATKPKAAEEPSELNSQLRQWPVQLRLVNPKAPYFEEAHLLVAADCTAYAYGNFHNEFIKDRILVIGCPKLDDNDYNKEKIAEILKSNDIKSITVVRMEVPCCGGIVQAVKAAMLESQVIVPYNEITVNVDGSLK
ncbi:MAG: 4Fe-4S binding protein [Bacillota bacterium]|nr:4Fe-4S binding protein [Bacillota bacterium]